MQHPVIKTLQLPVVAASLAIAFAADASAQSMRPLVNSYVVGEGYDTIVPSNWQQCVSECLADDRCRMIEFYRPEQKCNLYGHRNTAYNNSNVAIVAVKEW